MTYPDATVSDPWPLDLSVVFHADLKANITDQLNLLVPRVKDASWTVPSLGSSWVAYTGATSNIAPQYRLKAGVVSCKGSMKSGTQSTGVFTFPAGQRPLGDQFFMCYATGGAVEVAVLNTGVLVVGSYVGSGANTQVALDQVKFIAEQ